MLEAEAAKVHGLLEGGRPVLFVLEQEPHAVLRGYVLAFLRYGTAHNTLPVRRCKKLGKERRPGKSRKTPPHPCGGFCFPHPVAHKWAARPRVQGISAKDLGRYTDLIDPSPHAGNKRIFPSQNPPPALPKP